MTWHRLEPFDDTFYDRAPFRVVTKTTIDASCEQSFATLKTGELWPKWIAAVRSVEWTSPRPLGPDATRIVTMKNGTQIDETFIVWEENQRMGFRVDQATTNALRSFGELYELTPTDDGKCHLRWTFALHMRSWWMRFLLLLLWPVMFLALRSVLKRYAYVAQKYGENALQDLRKEAHLLDDKNVAPAPTPDAPNTTAGAP